MDLARWPPRAPWRRRAWALAGALLCATHGAARVAAACDFDGCQSEGAADLPGTLALRLPFADGERVRVGAGYGPGGGSALHCRAQDSRCANDWHALDLSLPDRPDAGRGQPVLAAAAGEVIAAGWGTAGWSAYGRRVYVRHDGGDGHAYTTMYAHLESIAVEAGDPVDAGDTIGTLGSSCEGADRCGNFATPHVHFAVHRDSRFGGSGTGGSYGGRAVRPEPLDGYAGIERGDDLVAGHGAPPEPDPAPEPEPEPEPTPAPEPEPPPGPAPEPGEEVGGGPGPAAIPQIDEGAPADAAAARDQPTGQRAGSTGCRAAGDGVAPLLRLLRR